MSWIRRIRSLSAFDCAVAAGIAMFSWWLMASTFSYDTKDGGMFIISSRLWSDFGAHIPLIRSFSRGLNWPPQSPLFPGEPIRYHFLLYAITGWLERAGMRIDYALNIPSALGFAGMLCGVYLMGIRLFRSRAVGALAVLFVLFNGTFSFTEFFASHPLGPRTLADVVANQQFSSFGPWDGKTVSAFWSLNIFTNQRHLAPGYAIALLLILMYAAGLRPAAGRKGTLARAVVTAAGMGILLYLNQAAALILLVWLVLYFLIDRTARLPLILAGITTVPLFLLSRILIAPSGAVAVDPWYLVRHPVTPVGVVNYWIMNLGLHVILLPLGILLSPKRAKLLAIPLLPLFIVPNIFRFSPDMINNHKFFNFLIIVMGLFSAQYLVWLWRIRPHGRIMRFLSPARYPVAVLSFLLLTLSGIIDFFPVARDYKTQLDDGRSPDVQAFTRLVPPGRITLNSVQFYHPATIAGRPIYFGYPYFTWSYGYDKDERERIYLNIYRARTLEQACRLLTRANISYIELSDRPDPYIEPNTSLFTSFDQIYRNDTSGLTLYDVGVSCREVATE